MPSVLRGQKVEGKNIPQYDLTTKDTVKLAARGSGVFL